MDSKNNKERVRTIFKINDPNFGIYSVKQQNQLDAEINISQDRFDYRKSVRTNMLASWNLGRERSYIDLRGGEKEEKNSGRGEKNISRAKRCYPLFYARCEFHVSRIVFPQRPAPETRIDTYFVWLQILFCAPATIYPFV